MRLRKSLEEGAAAATATLLLCCWAGVGQARLTDLVDPFIGVEGPTPGSTIAGGNSFPGAAMPWGMVKAGIDTSFLGLPEGIGNDCNAGFSPIGNVTAVSMTHVSGSGGNPTYGLVSQMPLLGTLDGVNLGDNTTYWQNRSLGQETATVGLFTTVLLNGVKIEITSSNHSAFIRYTFPGASNSSSGIPSLSNDANPASYDAHVFVDLTHVLPAADPTTQSYSQKYVHGDVHVRSDASSEPSYFGSASYTGGWPQPDIHTLHFCGNFSVPSTSPLVPTTAHVAQGAGDRVDGAGTLSWPYDPVIPPSSEKKPIVRSYTGVKSYAGAGMGLGAFFSWRPSDAGAEAAVLEARVGISYGSPEQACAYVADELPESKSFDDVVEQSRNEWEERVLGSVTVEDDGSPESQNETLKKMLYSALYQTGLMPTDKTGENPYWESDETKPYYDDHYTLWDTYRATLPLFHVLYTSTYTRIVKGLINIFKYEGYLPAGRAANWNGRVQGGTHADTVLADAFVKSVFSYPTNGSRGRGELDLSDADWADAYAAMVKDADVLPARNVDPVAFDGATKEGRGALDEQLRLRFLTRNHSRSLSRGVEYPQNDFSVWSVAAGLRALNKLPSTSTTSDIERYRDRADWWQEQWNPGANTTLEGVGTFFGFVGARNADRSWNFTGYEPRNCSNCGWGGDIYEAKVWETSFAAAPHDMAKVVELMGGDEAFVKRLDASFLPGFGTSVGVNNDAGSALFNPGNEPSFLTPFLYNYIPRSHHRTVNATRAILDTYYNPSRSGYPGNIDSGALPAWLVWNVLGLFPVAGQPLYLLSAPRFPAVTVRLFYGTPQAMALRIRAQGLSAVNMWVEGVSLNGRKLDRAWVAHDELGAGGELVFEMGPAPTEWDTGDRPWSLSPWGQ